MATLSAIGCAGEPAAVSDRGAPAGAATPGPVASFPLDTIKGNLPVDFEVRAYQGADTLGGEQVLLSQVLAQGKPVALNFFAGECPPCRAEMPDLEAVHSRLGERFILLGIDLGPFTGLGTNEDAAELIDELNLTFPAGSTSDPQVVSRYRVLGIPSTVFVTTDGKVHRKWDGPLSQSKMEELVEQMIAASRS
jgi:thiol-disulfide isomerase/thioredoxin